MVSEPRPPCFDLQNLARLSLSPPPESGASPGVGAGSRDLGPAHGELPSRPAPASETGPGKSGPRGELVLGHPDRPPLTPRLALWPASVPEGEWRSLLIGEWSSLPIRSILFPPECTRHTIDGDFLTLFDITNVS